MMLITAVHMIEYERRLSEINEVTTDVQMIVYELEMIVDQFEPPPQMDFYFDSPPSDQLSPPEEHNQIRAPI